MVKSVAAHHPIIEQLNQLHVHDFLEAEPLIFQCFEEGIFEWSNPKFLSFLDHTIRNLMIMGRHERRQLRGLMYARYVADHMPVGVDDGVRARITAIASTAAPIFHMDISPRKNFNDWLAYMCHGYQAERKMMRTLRRRQYMLEHQQPAS